MALLLEIMQKVELIIINHNCAKADELMFRQWARDYGSHVMGQRDYYLLNTLGKASSSPGTLLLL